MFLLIKYLNFKDYYPEEKYVRSGRYYEIKSGEDYDENLRVKFLKNIYL